MLRKLQLLISILFLSVSINIYAQSPNLGKVAQFALFSSNGPISNTGNSFITGDVGTNGGSSTAFGNVNGVMHDNDSVSAIASADLLSLYNTLNSAVPAFFPSSLLGNGLVFVPGVYSITAASTLNGNLILDAQQNPNSIFIIKIAGPLSSAANSKVRLTNGALACNVFWIVEGQVSLAAHTYMSGTIIANNAAILLSTGDTLNGRALSTTGAITIDGVLIDKPIGCGSSTLTGPTAPNLGKASCFSLFSSIGALSNVGISNISGDVGSNSGAVTGFDPLLVTGTLHLLPNLQTSEAAADLLIASDYLTTLNYDIELLYPAQFGRNLVLTPHTYLLNAATTFTDTLYLDAQGNENAVFVLKSNGAFSTSTYARVILINGAKASNVYWKIEGALNINDYSTILGTIICNNAAASSVKTNTTLSGKILITNGAVEITNTSIIPTDLCSVTGINSFKATDVSVYPNPSQGALMISIQTEDYIQSEIVIIDQLGRVVLQKLLTSNETKLNTSELITSVYYYRITNNSVIIKSGKLVIE